MPLNDLGPFAVIGRDDAERGDGRGDNNDLPDNDDANVYNLFGLVDEFLDAERRLEREHARNRDRLEEIRVRNPVRQGDGFNADGFGFPVS